MFFEGDRIDAMREMILADSTSTTRKAALAKLLPYQRSDFLGIFKELKGFPATIRFLDPPLHEFLPHTKEQQMDSRPESSAFQSRRSCIACTNCTSSTRCLASAAADSESSILKSPEMQARAVLEAAADAQKAGIKAKPEIMIPLVGFKKELDQQVGIVHAVAKAVQAERKVKLVLFRGHHDRGSPRRAHRG
jgi:pyruvate,orthophosphate dikinase